MLHYFPLLSCLLFHQLSENIYNIFSVIWWFNFFWVSHIPGGKIGRHDTWWRTCSSIVSGFVIFTHRLFVYQMWMLLKQFKNRDEVIIIILYSKWWNLLCFLADKSWDGKTITKTIQFTYINYDTVISWIETLGLI